MGKQIEDKKTFSQIISVGLIFIGAGLCLSVSFNLDRCAYKEKALPSLQEETSLVYQNCMTAINEELNVLGKNTANDIIGLHIFNNYIYIYQPITSLMSILGVSLLLVRIFPYFIMN